jgi:hypothetical protein
MKYSGNEMYPRKRSIKPEKEPTPSQKALFFVVIIVVLSLLHNPLVITVRIF